MTTMKHAVITGIRQAELIDIPIPEPREDWVLVKVHAIPLCTEYKSWLDGTPYAGHEAAGEVVAVARSGRDARVKVGDRVAVMPGAPCGKCGLCLAGDYIHCRSWIHVHDFTGNPAGADTHVQYLLKQDWMLARIPDEVSYEVGALACCGLGPTFGALDRFSAGAFDTVLVTGAGPVGTGGIVNAKYRGSRVVSVDAMPWRLGMAREMGADLVVDARDAAAAEQILAFTGGRGVDIALETSGTNGGARLCLDTLRRRGNMAFIGENGEFPVHVSNDFIRKGITVIGQWHYNFNGNDRIMQVIRDSALAPRMITHRFPMTRINEALELSSRHECCKIMIDPWA